MVRLSFIPCFRLVLCTALSCSAPHRDPHSFSHPDEIAVTHIDLDLAVRFDQRILSGSARLRLDHRKSARELWLDTRGLEIQRITADSQETPARFRLGDAVEYLGTPLIVQIPPGTKFVTVYYSTTEHSDALQWLEPRQTSGGHPFLFTQSQAILARSWVPCQDSPGSRFTYSARITCPPGLMAVMSARNDTATSADGIYRFNMELPIPAYLLALAVGNIAFQSLGPRTGIYAEPAMLDRAAWEFADTESMLQAAERLLGPYRWGRYDLLVLPPSFPFGGMENPRLTFATPTVIAGDRSLVALVAHELAHSWSGNLTTAATWNDIWLNEGFTTYFERRIVEEVYGREYADMEAVIARQILDDDLREMGPDSADTQLYLQLEGRSPDDASDFIYEKGYFFLRLLEESFGREEWDRFLLGYFDRFAFRTITTREFTTYLRDRLTHHDRKLEESLRIEEWIYGRGVPSNCPTVRSEAFVRVDREIAAWRDGKPARKLKTSQWTSQQWIHFLKGLPGELPLNRMEELDKAFLFSRSGNSEIMFEWLARVVETEYHEGYPALERFLTSVGRRKFVKPLFGKLVETRDGRLLAQRIYAKARPCYHPLTVRSIDAIIGAHPDSSDN